MRILFVMHYPGYLRYFDTVIKLLADRGHRVWLSFESPHKQPEGLEAIDSGHDGIRVLEALPKRRDAWGLVALRVRNIGDYARYLHPRLADASYLRARMEKVLPRAFRGLARIPRLSPGQVRLLLSALATCEAAIPSSRAFERHIAAVQPDAVLVTPLVTDGSPQTDVVKSARALGIPTALCVASWDHLTTKGLIRVVPDRVLVWNDTQRQEAVELHGVPGSKVEVTGAQPFDRWFDREPSVTRAAFCARVGLPDDRPFVLFVGSTASISKPEAERRFVERWIAAIRGSENRQMRDVAVLIRPHPYNTGAWADADLSHLGRVAIWPRRGSNPVNESDRHDYFNSLYYCAAVVGINTSAMIEAAIVGRPVHTVLAPEFAETQVNTLHFDYMLPERGGFLRVSDRLDEHVAQLGESLSNPELAAAEAERFVESFVRPRGLEQECTPIAVEAIERLAAGSPELRRPPAAIVAALRPPLWLTGVVLAASDRRLLARRLNRISKAAAKRLRKAAARRGDSRVSSRLEGTARRVERANKRLSRRLKGRPAPTTGSPGEKQRHPSGAESVGAGARTKSPEPAQRPSAP